jgi:hypothetical protein
MQDEEEKVKFMVSGLERLDFVLEEEEAGFAFEAVAI